MKKYSKAILPAVTGGLKMSCIVIPIVIWANFSAKWPFGMDSLIFILIMALFSFTLVLIANIVNIRRGQPIKNLTFKGMLTGDGKPW